MFESLSLGDWLTLILGLLLFISEALPFSEKIKSNGIFQAIVSVAKAVWEALKKK